MRKFAGMIWGGALMACGMAAGMVLSGCNIASAVFYVVHGPDEKIPPKFQLPPGKATVVFVDDRNSRLPSRDLREMIATAAGEVLLAEGGVQDLIDPRAALGVASKDRFGEPMTIAAIGKAVQAETVIYVTVDSFTMSTDGQSIAPAAVLRVKVIDVTAEKRIWPEESEGYSLGVQTPPKHGTLTTSPAEMYKVRQEAASRAGLGVAQLFVEYIARASAAKGSASSQ